MLYPFQYPHLYQQFQVDAGGGLLLFGPPGTGKTELAAAAANEIKADFFSVSAADIMSKWVGEAEKNVKQLFAEARRSKRAVIFLDDCQQLMSSDDSGNSRVTKAVLGEFLTGLEGLVSRTNREKTSILFIAATNEPWVIAPGMLSRFGGRIIYMGLPSTEERQRILQAKLTDVPLSEDVDLAALAARTERYSGRELLNICRRTKIQAIKAIADSGTHSPITHDMFLEQIARVKPATTPEALRRFDEWCAKHGSTSTK
jgi:transitional endoplasmic reticulum ATPase